MSKFIKFLKKYFFFFGLALFIWIISKMNINELVQGIKDIKFLYLILAISTTFPIIFIKAVCWKYIKSRLAIKYNLKDSWLMYYSSVYLGFITPGKLGELAKVIYLKQDGHSFNKSLVTVFLDRLSDLVFLLSFVFIGSLFFLSIFQKEILIIIWGLMALVILIIFLLKIGFIKWALGKIFNIFLPEKYKNSWKINFQDFITNIKIYKLKNYIIIFIITGLSWLFYYLQMYALARGLGINIPFLYLAISGTVAGLITLIPISLFGIGTRDATLILLFSPFSVAKEQIIIFSALILLVAVLAASTGLICWLKKPLRI